MLERLTQIVRSVARRYKNLPQIDPRDLQQSAFVALLRYALKHNLDDASDGYLATIALGACKEFLRAQSQPISHKKNVRIGTPFSVVPLTDQTLVVQDAEARAHRWLVRKRIKREIDRTLSSCADPVIARRVLLDDEKPVEVAEDLRLDITKVYTLTRQAKRALLANARLEELWHELRP